jgi:HK97 family phage major capsid protein
MSYLSQQIESRNVAWHAAKALLDGAAAAKRDLTGEEQQSYDRIMADIDSRADVIKSLTDAEERGKAIEASLVEAPEVRTEPRPTETPMTDADILRKMVTGEIRGHTFERRNLSTGGATTGQKLVPVGFYDQIVENLQYTGPWPTKGGYTVLQTAAGEVIKVPTETARPTGTAVAEGASFAISDPTYSEMSLGAFKYGTLVVASKELLMDSGIDLEAFLGRQIGVALGTAVNSALTLGTGTVQPTGISVSAGSALTGGTGVAGVPTADNLVDLVHGVDSLYAMRPSAAFQMRRTTIGAVRKLKDGAGNYIYNPASGVGSPDTLFGYALIENPYVAAAAVGAKSALFGAMDYFYVRQVGGIEVVRSDEAYFSSDQIAWRATIRIDSGLGNSAAVKYFLGGTA